MPEASTLPPSLLRCEYAWVESLGFSVRADWEARSGEIGVDAEIDIRAGDGPNERYVGLGIFSNDDAEDGSPYDFTASLLGLFSVGSEASADEAERLFELNAPAQLYGIARGALASASGLSPFGPLLLPSVNLVAALRRVDE